MDGANVSRENKEKLQKEKLQKFEQQMEWQKAKIIYLETKVKEKSKIEKELEESRKVNVSTRPNIPTTVRVVR